MGEYAKFNGRQIKMGTCEDMFYLRYDQRHLVEPESNSLDPTETATLAVIRFRFPFPDEDGTPPGEYDNPFKGIGVYGVDIPDEVEHHTVQFVAGNKRGYLVSLPCPESEEGKNFPHHFHKNGCSGPVRIVQQAIRNGNLALICECGACGSKYNLPTMEHAQPVIDALQKQADSYNENDTSKRYYLEIMSRIKAGYNGAAVCQ